MEIHLPPELEQKLRKAAEQRGLDVQSLVRKAVERMVEHDEQLIREIECAVAAANRGDFIEHDEVARMIDRRYPG